MNIIKNTLLVVITCLIILFLVLIGIKPVVIEAYLNAETFEEDVAMIDLGVIPKTNSSKVLIANNNIYINGGGSYEVEGILYNGTIYIDTSEDVTLNFNGVTLVNEINSVIDNRKSAKVVINLEEDSNNILSDGSSSASAIKSVGDLFLEGNGSMLIYGNNGNGITVNGGSFVVNGINLYVVAMKDAFNITEEFLINAGVVLGFGNGKMQPTSELSKQNTLLFNFNSAFLEGTTFALQSLEETSIINFAAIRDFKTLTLSTPDLDKGKYRMYQNIECDAKIKNGIYNECVAKLGDEVNIGITDTFIVDKKWNWYGSMDIIINLSLIHI